MGELHAVGFVSWTHPNFSSMTQLLKPDESQRTVYLKVIAPQKMGKTLWEARRVGFWGVFTQGTSVFGDSAW